MKNKLVFLIRKILIRTVLPLRKRKEDFLSKFRFSIVFRISLNYLKLMVVYGILYLFLFSIFFLGVETNQYINIGKEIAEGYQSGLYALQLPSITVNQNVNYMNPYKNEGLTMMIMEDETNTIYYNDIVFPVPENRRLLSHIYYDRSADENRLIYIHKEHFTLWDRLYTIYFNFDLSENEMSLKALVPGMTLLYLLIVAAIINGGRKGDTRLFRSISAMSATANRLNVNSLHSERLNVEGTKSELKDLAATINSMLDRIETSYESQKQFVSDASHELRTPIAVIQGYANLLNRWGTKNENVLLESINAIQSEAKEMQDLVEKLLFLSRHDKKTMKLEKVKFNMCEMVEDMVKETRMVIQNRSIQSPNLEDVMVYGDKQALKQAVRVLIDNAVKYTKNGGIICISCENQNGDCVITIQDNGIGMTRKDLDNIFERFYRSDYVRNEKISGHGLGLSIARLIILKHTGRIKVRSQYKKGSSFIITLPKRELY